MKENTKIVDIKCLIIVSSYHHNNTAQIANEFSKVLNAVVVTPEQVNLEKIKNYNLIGFGAGIDSGKHYKPLLDLVDRMTSNQDIKSFIFSTSAMQSEKKVRNDHSALRIKLKSKGYNIVNEFSCKGFNTNSFLKYFGGINKGRPNIFDFENAKIFANNLKLSFIDNK